MADPRHLVLPDGIVSTGWPAVRETSAQVGIFYDEWQASLNRAMLAKDASGLYAADTVLLSLCRQSGKTFDVGGVCFADSIIHPGTTTVWTAHRFKVARETFNELRGLATQPQMLPHIDPEAITTAAGNETIPFRNGSRIVFAARERGAVRGFTKVRRLVLDEAQILTESAMSDLVPTTNQAENPQIILMGTPPRPQDPAEVFSSLRAEALAGTTEGVLLVEYAAEPDDDPDDWDTVAKANPSFPKRTSKRAVLRLRKLLASDDDYMREGLGVWTSSGSSAEIDPEVWAALEERGSQVEGAPTFAIDKPPHTSAATIAAAGFTADGRLHVEMVQTGYGTGWVPDRLAELQKKHGGQVVLDPSGPAGALLDQLLAAGVDVQTVSRRDYGQACGSLLTRVQDGRLVHIGQPALTAAVDAGRRRKMGELWTWSRRDTSSDISPLVAVTLAAWGAGKAPTKKKRSGRAVFA